VLISGEVWVGYGKALWTSNSDMFGAIFANDFEVSAPMNLHYDIGVQHSGNGNDCPDGGPDASPPPLW
jgi:hypothetical protein